MDLLHLKHISVQSSSVTLVLVAPNFTESSAVPWSECAPQSSCTSLTKSLSETQTQSPNLREAYTQHCPHPNTVIRSTSTTYLFMMCFPTSVEPVNPIFRTSGWSESLWPISEPVVKSGQGVRGLPGAEGEVQAPPPSTCPS